MIVYKISLDMSGSNFRPKVAKKLISNNLYAASLLEVGDTWELGNGKQIIAKTNSIGIQHKELIAVNNEEVVEYEKAFVDFLQKNYKKLKEAKVDDINVDIDIYTSDDICSISIFDKNQLKTLTNCNASINLTYYRMKKKKIKEIWDI